MAKLERRLKGDFYNILNEISRGIEGGSVSASLEEIYDTKEGDAKCSVRVFERYSFMGGNRVSLSVTLFQKGSGDVHLCAVASGGSRALFFKMNTFGEEAFLDKLRDIVDDLEVR